MADTTAQQPWSLVGSLKAVPLGTMLIMGVSLFLFVINLISNGAITGSFCLVPTNYTHSPVIGLPRLFGYGLAHSGIVHFLVAVVTFPIVSTTLEFKIGTLPFLYMFFVLGVLTGLSYCIMMWVWSFIWPQWGLYPINGLDIPFFTFLTIEALSKRGLYEFASNLGVKIPEIMFPLPFVVAFIIILPYSSWISHLGAIVVGLMYFLGMFESIMLTNSRTQELETSGMFAWIVSRPGFVAATAAISLPLPGAYPDLMDANVPVPSSLSRGPIITRIQNAFSFSKYQPLNEANGYHDSAHQDVDPLLWDEDDDLEARGAIGQFAEASGTNPQVLLPPPTSTSTSTSPVGKLPGGL
ncbi:hypothetical protein BASA50_011046 [Batrachochytrium salamandrivorans]|uniref:rhomboid protease n=1 Tax=Batrachochytrium salamandrivorans TaxID=1357716 RepID=A0ABQ8EWQ4_9FUNG|nr:hypothetical protein BASA50_011046 [Batrachochytrium salamandrivorans]KAH9265341.1 hypothetical protein BASA83_011153 [Batrachochytrium salamandrivorans]KAJ1327111.1 hypothetical protein BSLG_010458 [Batrachochytrium salamandrivorans]